MKKVFITGAGSGLGKEAALALARRGHSVIASVLYSSQMHDLKEIAKDEKLDITVLVLDILKETDREKTLDYDFDVFISNSAIGDSGSVIEMEVTKIENVFHTNVFANLRIMQVAISSFLKKKKHGRIVILSSLVRKNSDSFLVSLLCF